MSKSKEEQLYDAAKSGDIDKVEVILSQRNIDVNWENPDQVN
jgi:hypothetical protein